jgi:protein phosphatase
MTGPLRFEYGGCSDVGPVRSANEDRWLAEPARGRFAVVDGMGGHAGGQRAAELAVAALRAAPDLVSGMVEANRRIAAEAVADLAAMGCVATAVEVRDGMLDLAHVGDTAAFLVSRAGAELLTRRHTRAAAVQAERVLDDEEADRLGLSNQLLRDLGGGVKAGTDWIDRAEPVLVEPGDLLLLCSDGVHGPLSHAALTDRLHRAWSEGEAATDVAKTLVAAALAAGGRDNATAVVIRVLAGEQTTRPVLTRDDAGEDAVTRQVDLDAVTRQVPPRGEAVQVLGADPPAVTRVHAAPPRSGGWLLLVGALLGAAAAALALRGGAPPTPLALPPLDGAPGSEAPVGGAASPPVASPGAPVGGDAPSPGGGPGSPPVASPGATVGGAAASPAGEGGGAPVGGVVGAPSLNAPSGSSSPTGGASSPQAEPPR